MGHIGAKSRHGSKERVMMLEIVATSEKKNSKKVSQTIIAFTTSEPIVRV